MLVSWRKEIVDPWVILPVWEIVEVILDLIWCDVMQIRNVYRSQDRR